MTGALLRLFACLDRLGTCIRGVGIAGVPEVKMLSLVKCFVCR